MAGSHRAVLRVQNGDGIGGDTTAAAGEAGISPMGVHGGILVKHGSHGNLSAAVLFGVPAVEAVAAAAGGSGQFGELLVNGSHAGNGGDAAVAVKGNGVGLIFMASVAGDEQHHSREIATRLPLVVDILQGEGHVGVPLQPCIFVRFFGVLIVLVPVSGQIEIDDSLQNTVIHVGRRVAQVKAAGDPPVCLAIAGCLALDGDKVCGNVDPRKISFCNCGADGGDLEGCTVRTGLVGGRFLFGRVAWHDDAGGS